MIILDQHSRAGNPVILCGAGEARNVAVRGYNGAPKPTHERGSRIAWATTWTASDDTLTLGLDWCSYARWRTVDPYRAPGTTRVVCVELGVYARTERR
jgi:hypothetical protein